MSSTPPTIPRQRVRLAVPSIPISVCELELCQKQQRAAEEEDGCAWRVGEEGGFGWSENGEGGRGVMHEEERGE